MTKTFGIDYASVDGNSKPDFKAAYAAGVRFAILRGAWGVAPDYVVKRDRAALRAAGIQFGAYLFLRCPTKTWEADSPVDQAKAFIDAIGPLEPGDLPPTLDVEFPGTGRSETIFSARQALDWCESAYRALENFYPTVMTYTSRRVWKDDLSNLPNKQLGAGPLWCKTGYYHSGGQLYDLDPHQEVGKLPTPWSGSDYPWIRQIQGDARGVPGFNNTVDINLFYNLELGDICDRVRWVQRKLKLVEDGVFGIRTETAVKMLQRANNLVDDGVIGPKTFAALCR